MCSLSNRIPWHSPGGTTPWVGWYVSEKSELGATGGVKDRTRGREGDAQHGLGEGDRGDERRSTETLVGEEREQCAEHCRVEVSLGPPSWEQIWGFPGESWASGAGSLLGRWQ